MRLRASSVKDWLINDLVTDHSAWRAKWDFYPGVQLVLFNRLLRVLRDSAKTRHEIRRLSTNMEFSRKPLTLQVDLPGGQSRLRQIILYVAEKCRNAEYFGAVKLNKIIWKADFNSYADRQKPVTGREYRRQMFGPVPKELIWVQDEMLKDGAIYLDFRDFGNGYIEKRTIALDRANLDPFFDEIDLGYVDRSIDYYWPMTGVESSDESHGVAWKTRKNGDPMPYELAFLSDAPVQPEQLKKIQALIKDRQLTSV